MPASWQGAGRGPHRQLPAAPAAAGHPATLADELSSRDPASAGQLLQTWPPDVAAAALRQYARRDPGQTFSVASELLQPGAAPTPIQGAALEALGDMATQQAADLAAQWAEAGTTLGTKETRKAARRALLRLAQGGVRPTPRPEATPVPPPTQREHVRRALMTAVDWQGGRLLYLLIDLPPAGAYMARAEVSTSKGLSTFEAVESTRRYFERYVSEVRPRQSLFTLAEIPAAYARWLIGEALAVTRAQRKPLPADFPVFREALAPPDTAPPPPISEALEAVDAGLRPDLVERSVDLLERPELAIWVPVGDERMTALATEWRTVGGGPLALPPSVTLQRRQAILNQVADLLIGPGGVAGLRRRLEDNALVMLQAGASQEAMQLLVAATRLHPDDPASAYSHPLVRALAQRALDFALSGATEGRETRWDDWDLNSNERGDLGKPAFERRPSGLILPR